MAVGEETSDEDTSDEDTARLQGWETAIRWHGMKGAAGVPGVEYYPIFTDFSRSLGAGLERRLCFVPESVRKT